MFFIVSTHFQNLYSYPCILYYCSISQIVIFFSYKKKKKEHNQYVYYYYYYLSFLKVLKKYFLQVLNDFRPINTFF